MRHIQHTFNQIIKDQLTSYKGMYECDCPQLTRKLPFRAQFTQSILEHIKQIQPTTEQPLVYVSHGPGGLFFDFVLINKLIAHGYHNITAIFIEELYQENVAILQACLDLKTWFRELKQAHSRQPTVTTHFYQSVAEHAQACKQQAELRGTILLITDPDDKSTIPNFDCSNFKTAFESQTQATMHHKSSFYALFAQNGLRHMLIGTVNKTESDTTLLIYEHLYGNQSLGENTHRRAFLNGQEALPFELVKNSVQINGKLVVYPELSAFLLNKKHRNNS